LERPTGKVLDVFADDESSDEARAQALFGCPDDDRVLTAPGSSIIVSCRSSEPPTLAWWHSAWTATVEPGSRSDIPQGWPVALDVAWRPWTVVYFADVTHEAVDFALMVGDAGGTGDKAPHVYLFQCKALTTKNVTQGTEDVERRLIPWYQDGRQAEERSSTACFQTTFAATHVWRRAGINSAASK
jgi:hypothetical protein